MRTSPENAQAFYHNPLEVFSKVTNAPEDLIKEIEEIQKKWPHMTESGPDEYVKHELLSAAAPLQDYAQGWDVVAALRQKEINHGLSLAYGLGMMPKDFDVTFEVEFGPIKIPVEAKGTFGATQIKCGTGSNIDLAIPVKNGTISFSGTPAFDIGGIKVIMTVNLVYVLSPVQPEKGHKYAFQLDIKSEKAFVGIDLENLPPSLKKQKAALETTLLELLRNHVPSQPFTVFEVTLEGIDEDYPYLIPKLVQYAFLNDSKCEDDNTLGALLLTTGEKPGAGQILNGTIPEGSRAAVIISNPLLMQKVVMPKIVEALKVDSSYITASGNPVVVRNTKSFDYYEKVKGYTAKITSLEIQVADSALKIALKGTTSVSPGINVDFWATGEYTFVIETKDGKQTISYKQKSFNSGHSTWFEWWVWLLGCLGGLIGIIVLLIIQAIVNAKVPDLDGSMFASALKPINWNYVGLFNVQVINLPGDIQVGGTVPFLNDQGQVVQ